MSYVVQVFKQHVDALVNSLSSGTFSESDKSLLSQTLDNLDSLSVSREVLHSTKLGSALTKLAKALEGVCPNSARRVTGIIEKWKAQLRSGGADNPAKKQKFLPAGEQAGASSPLAPAGGQKLSGSAPDLSKLVEDLAAAAEQGQATPPADAKGLSRAFSAGCLTDPGQDGDELDLPAYSGPAQADPTRAKALRYLFRCFLIGQDFGPELGKLGELVYDIERGLHDHYVVERGSQKGYNLQLKCIAFNLKDLKNTLFNYKVYSGLVPVAELVTMSSLQMASDEKKLERNEILEQSLEACQSDWAIRNIFLSKRSAGQFKCGKCGSRQTSYYQLQTRSSDEPMTTFVTCLVCKNRWRF